MIVSANYIIIQGGDATELCRTVERKILEGYELAGGLSVVVRGEHVGFFQALLLTTSTYDRD